MKKNNPIGVGDILDALKKKTTLGKMLEHAEIWEHWREIAGSHLADHGRPKAVKDMQLRVEVDSAVWMHKYNYHKWAIIKRINRLARKELVSDMFFELVPDGEDVADE